MTGGSSGGDDDYDNNNKYADGHRLNMFKGYSDNNNNNTFMEWVCLKFGRVDRMTTAEDAERIIKQGMKDKEVLINGCNHLGEPKYGLTAKGSKAHAQLKFLHYCDHRFMTMH